MKCIFAYIEENYTCGWFLVSKSDFLNLNDLKFFINFYGKENIKLKCGDFDFYDYGFPEFYEEF